MAKMKDKLNPSIEAIKTLFFQWIVDSFLIPKIRDFQDSINLIVLRNHLLDFSLEAAANELSYFSNLQINQKFYYIDNIDNLDFDSLRNSFSETISSEKQLVITINSDTNGSGEKLKRCIALKNYLGLKYLLILANGFDHETNEIYGIKEADLNDYVLSDSIIDNFTLSLVGQTNWLFYGLNSRKTVLEFAYNLNSYEISNALKNRYCGFVYLFDFYSRSGYLPNNLYDGYYSYLNFVLQHLMKSLNPTHKAVTYSRERLIRFIQRAALLSQFVNGSWVIQLHQLASKEIEFDIFEQIKYKSPLWTTSNNQVYWSENSLRDYWASDYLAGKITESDSAVELIFSLSRGFNNLTLAFLVAKIARRLLRPHLAIEILAKYLTHYPDQYKQVVDNCVEIAGANVLGWKRIGEKLRGPISSVENQDVSSLIGVL